MSSVLSSMAQNGRMWRQWFSDAVPETARFPLDCDSKLDEMQRLLMVRCLRPDRVVFAIKHFVANRLGPEYATAAATDTLEAIWTDSSWQTPIILLSADDAAATALPGYDAMAQLLSLSAAKGVELQSLSLGAGQHKAATILLSNAMKHGNWVFFENCHLSPSWLPTLSQLLATNLNAEHFAAGKIHKNFRLWLSCSASAALPTSMLQRALLLSNEAASSLKLSLKRLFAERERGRNGSPSHDEAAGTALAAKTEKVLFCLAVLHSVLLLRGKLPGGLGWNAAPYFLSPSDFVSATALSDHWWQSAAAGKVEAVRHLMATTNYGGRMRDCADATLLAIYALRTVNDDALSLSNYAFDFGNGHSGRDRAGHSLTAPPQQGQRSSFGALSRSVPAIRIPDDGRYRQYIESLPEDGGGGGDGDGGMGSAVQFGLHQNADICLHLKQSNVLLQSLAQSEGGRFGGGRQSKSRRKEAVSDSPSAESAAADAPPNRARAEQYARIWKQIPPEFKVQEMRAKHHDEVHSAKLILLMLREMERLNVE